MQQQELFLTVEIGSDHVDLPTVAAEGFIVVEVVGNNTVSVAEAQLMCALVLKRNLLSGHHQATSEGWDMVAVAHQACVLEGKTVGTVWVDVEEVKHVCKVGCSDGDMCLFTDLLGDLLCRIHRSPDSLMLVVETTIGTNSTEIVGIVRGCAKTAVSVGITQQAKDDPIYTKVGSILGLRVLPSHWRKGMGKKLADREEDEVVQASYTYNIYNNWDPLEDALRLFDRMCMEQDSPKTSAVNLGSFNVMVDAYCHAERGQYAIKVFGKMVEKRPAPDVLSSNNLIDWLGKNKLVGKSEGWYMKEVARAVFVSGIKQSWPPPVQCVILGDGVQVRLPPWPPPVWKVWLSMKITGPLSFKLGPKWRVEGLVYWNYCSPQYTPELLGVQSSICQMTVKVAIGQTIQFRMHATQPRPIPWPSFIGITLWRHLLHILSLVPHCLVNMSKSMLITHCHFSVICWKHCFEFLENAWLEVDNSYYTASSRYCPAT
jgi:pentatricopeptide repeat protein